MARLPFERDQNFSWEKEFDSELHLRSGEDRRFEEHPQFDDLLRPESRDTDQPRTAEQHTDQSDHDADAREYEAPEYETRGYEPRAYEPREYESSEFESDETEPGQRPILIWPEDDTPKMERGTRAAYLALLVVLAFGAVWVLERDIEGPATTADSTTTEPPPLTGVPATAVPDSDDLVASRELSEPSPTVPPADVPAQQADTRPIVPSSPPQEAASSPRPSLESAPPAASAAPPTNPAPAAPIAAPPASATAPTRTTPAPETSATSRPRTPARPTPAPDTSATSRPTTAADRQKQPAPERRLNIEPPARPPYRSIPEQTPSRAATTSPAPPVQTTSPPAPAQVAASPAPPSPSPSQTATATAPPGNAVAETAAATLPRVAVDDPPLRPPSTPPVPPASQASVATPPAAGTRPAAAPTSAASASAGVDLDSGAIRDVLGRYRSAFNALDAKAAVQVWPTVNQQTLDRAFGQLEEQRLSFDRCTIAVKGVLAEANCSGSARYVPRVGSRSAQTAQRQWNFTLKKAGEGAWLIQHVEAR